MNNFAGDKLMKTILFGFLSLVSCVWYMALSSSNSSAQGTLLRSIWQDTLTLGGLLSIALMSLCMLLSIRPVWLEKPLGGLDRIYRLHKWSGILAVGFGVIHWLVSDLGEEGDDEIADEMEESEHKLAMVHESISSGLRDFGGDLGEPGFYLVLIMLAVTLWKFFPYKFWRQLHRVMPIIYLLLAFHAVILAPPGYWTQAVGMLLAGCITVGVVASIVSLTGAIGRRRQVDGTVVSVIKNGNVTELTCRLDGNWKNHRPGQFAFITFKQREGTHAVPGFGNLFLRFEGAHPFTIASASANRGDGTITFCIKDLGDFTRKIAQQIQVGQPVRVEGPYGRFQMDRHSQRRRQIWVAGGIGITPFLAGLESRHLNPAEASELDLHYCTRDRDSDCFVNRLQVLCGALPGVRLFIHSTKHGEVLTAQSLKLADDPGRKVEVWFCGPLGLANSLKSELKKKWNGGLRFHQEAFEMR
ncbi:ferredoxin reductase family protein [Propionivibrio sp.]|uniref:ferredoxin reductase family protein n=1 Tax=Propionivibrio sp. TaxID=2212460 RepID=UPI003BF01471